jgi:hypothetical protein
VALKNSKSAIKLLQVVLAHAPIAIPIARIFGVLFKALHVSVTIRAITYMFCAMGQRGLLGFSFRTPRPPGKELAREVRGHPDFREAK